jgi:hypothetical protein
MSTPTPEAQKSPSVANADASWLARELARVKADYAIVVADYHAAIARARVAEAALVPLFKKHEVVIIAAVAFLAGLAAGHFI